jgi:hypothetical protein
MNDSKQVNLEAIENLPETEKKWYENYKVSNWVYDKIYDFWWAYLRRGMNRIKHMLKWIPILWNDYDFDSGYLIKIMEFKLKGIQDTLKKNNMYVGWEYDVAKINVVRKLLKAHEDETYATEYTDFYDSNFDFVQIDEKDEKGDNYYKIEENNKSESLDDFFAKYPRGEERIRKDKEYLTLYPGVLDSLNNDERESEFDKKKSIAFNISMHNQHRADKLLFKIMNRDIRRWWD